MMMMTDRCQWRWPQSLQNRQDQQRHPTALPERSHGILFHVKFHQDRHYSPCGAKTRKFDQFRNYCGLPYPASWTNHAGPNMTYENVRLRAEFHTYRLNISPFRSKKTPNFVVIFQLQHSALAPSSGAETKSTATNVLPRSFSAL